VGGEDQQPDLLHAPTLATDARQLQKCASDPCLVANLRHNEWPMRSIVFLVALCSLLVSSGAPLPAEPAVAFELSAALAPVVALDDAARRRAVAERFAPTLYQETFDRARDLVGAFDFDGDWRGGNNAANVGRFAQPAVVYYTVLETATHWFVHYLPYHAVDYKRIGGHPHDTETILAVVRKQGRGARLEVLETRFHKVWYQYVAAGSEVSDVGAADDIDGRVRFGVDGHPAVYSQRIGHGLCGGLAPTSPIRELELRCDHRQAPRIQRQGIVYRHRGVAEIPRTDGPAVQEVGYALREIATSLWPRRDDPQAFAGLGGADAPWVQTPGRGGRALGEQFVDPARTLARRLRFPAPFALDYTWNPYLAS
jgi:hypothetical protein